MKAKAQDTPPPPLITFGEFLPKGDGTFALTPRVPRSPSVRKVRGLWIEEVDTNDACQILGVGRGCIHSLINTDREARTRIKYRFTSGHRGKRVFDVSSLLAYVDWTKTLTAKPRA